MTVSLCVATHSRRLMLVLVCTLAVICFEQDGGASNGTKPPANGVGSMGRGGTDIAWAGDPTVMNVNPAAIVDIPNDQLAVSPIALLLSVKYADAQNSANNGGGFFPYSNAAAVFDLPEWMAGTSKTSMPDALGNVVGETSPAETAPSTFDAAAAGEFVITAPVSAFPSRAEVSASGSSATLHHLALVAVYAPGTAQEYSTILASNPGPILLGSSSQTVATFAPLINPMTEAPAQIRLYGTADGHADVRLSLDGRESGSERVAPPSSEHAPKNVERVFQETPSEIPHLEKPEEPSNFKLGIGFFVQAGAGSDLTLKTDLYPEGTTHSSEISNLSLTPTLAYRFFDWLSIGAALQINYGEISITEPVTQDSAIMKGPLFPAGSLDEALGAEFNIPKEFGPAMKKSMNTSNQHPPGTPTHTDKPNDIRFSEITGTAEIKKAFAFGMGLRFGTQLKLTDRLTLGLTLQTPSMMQDYKGKAKVDFNRQIEAFRNNPTYGHSDVSQIDLFGTQVYAESRFTFDQVWNEGTVDLWTSLDENTPPTLTIPNFPLPSGSVISQLPNQGHKGFATEYDLTIKNFQLPAEYGVGLSYRLTDDWVILVDYKRILWSEAMDKFEVELSNGTNKDINTLLGSSSMDVTIPLNWSDQNVIAIGTELKTTPWLTLRTGYQYAKNPVPPETMLTLTPVIAEHHITVGASIQIWSAFRLDLGIMHVLENSVSIDKSQHTRDMNGSKITVGQDFLSLGFTFDF